MFSLQMFFVLVVVGVVGGAVAGLGGPGGIPVILALNLLVALSPTVSAATSSAIFIVATLVTTGLYYYSDGIDWLLALTVGLPALVGSHAGTRIADGLSEEAFSYVLVGVLVLTAVGITYQQRRPDTSTSPGPKRRRQRRTLTLVAVACLSIGVAAGITGIGGPGLTIPLMIVLGIRPIPAIGAGVASGVLITVNATFGHILQGNEPALLPLVVIGLPYVVSQLLGWRYVHAVSERTVAYSIAAVAVGGAVLTLV